MTEVFLDTNVLVYAYDLAEPAKRERARALLAEHPGAVISTQVLLEWFTTVTRKLSQPLEGPIALRYLQNLTRLDVVEADSELVQRAAQTSIEAQLSLWDAMIIEAAVLGGCSTILSEDMGAGQVIRGVRIENPFA